MYSDLQCLETLKHS